MTVITVVDQSRSSNNLQVWNYVEESHRVCVESIGAVAEVAKKEVENTVPLRNPWSSPADLVYKKKTDYQPDRAKIP